MFYFVSVESAVFAQSIVHSTVCTNSQIFYTIVNFLHDSSEHQAEHRKTPNPYPFCVAHSYNAYLLVWWKKNNEKKVSFCLRALPTYSVTNYILLCIPSSYFIIICFVRLFLLLHNDSNKHTKQTEIFHLNWELNEKK